MRLWPAYRNKLTEISIRRRLVKERPSGAGVCGQCLLNKRRRVCVWAVRDGVEPSVRPSINSRGFKRPPVALIPSEQWEISVNAPSLKIAWLNLTHCCQVCDLVQREGGKLLELAEPPFGPSFWSSSITPHPNQTGRARTDYGHQSDGGFLTLLIVYCILCMIIHL